MKTWKQEFLFVLAILLAVNAFKDNPFTLDLLAAAAVLLSFGHAQIADRLAEQEGLKSEPKVECFRKLLYYFIGKEILWCLYFFLSRSYSALAGVFIFLAYPVWRKFYRKHIRPL